MSAAGSDDGPCRVLLVDDEHLIVEFHAAYLAQAGMHVRSTTDPLQVEALLHEFAPDVLVLDLYMPGCNGVELAGRLRQQEAFAYLPILYLSAEQNAEVQMQALAVGADDFLPKTVTQPLLASAIRARTRRWRQHQALQAAQRRAEAALRVSEERKALVIEAAELGTWDWNLVTGAVHFNAQMARMLGYRLEELTPDARSLEQLVCPDDLPAVLHTMERHLRGKSPHHESECRLRHKSGEWIWVLDRGRVIDRDTNGKALRVAGTRLNITSRKLAEEALRELNATLESRVEERTALLLAAKAEAERANLAKSEFLSRMSHELRTPLNSILGYSQLIAADQELPASLREPVGMIAKGGWHLLDLINDLLDFSKIEAGRLDIVIEPVDLAATLAECLTTVKFLAEQHVVALVAAPLPAASPAPLRVIADPLRLRQVLINLLSNAIKYNRHDGSGSVSVSWAPSDDEHARIEIADTGIGIRAADLPLLFQPFSRLYLETYSIEGSGIGLALSKQLVEAMGGTISVASVAGCGSCFAIELPRASELPPSPAGVDAAGSAGSSSLSRALLVYVEDSPLHIRLVKDILSRHSDIEVLAVHTPELGLELAAAHQPDLIIMDINLPGMDGFAALDCLRRNSATRAIPVIALSANALPQEVARGRAAGFLDYLTKPIRVAEFEAAVLQALATRFDA